MRRILPGGASDLHQAHRRKRLFAGPGLDERAVFLLAALCKEVALAVPLLMVFYEHFLRGDSAVRFGERLSRYMPTFLVSAFYIVVHLAVIGDVSSVGRPAACI